MTRFALIHTDEQVLSEPGHVLLKIRGEGPRHKPGAPSALDTAGSVGTMVRMGATLNSRLTMIELPDSDSRAVRLGSLWLSSPAVIVFLRHYG